MVGLGSDEVQSNVAGAVGGPGGGWSAVGTGLYAWRRRPGNRTGALMVLLGFAWFNSTLVDANSDVVRDYAAVTAGLWGSVFLHLGIAFPGGRLTTRLDRAIVYAGYVVFPLAFLPGRAVGGVLYLALFIVVVARSARTWRAADPFVRLQLTPVFTLALLTFALVTIAQVAD